MSGQNQPLQREESKTGSEVMVVAGAMLVVLVLVLLARGTASCLRCWPDATPYVHYDVQLLLGGNQRGGVVGLERDLSALILGGDPGVGIMEREHLEREAGKLFYHLDQIITRNRQDPERLMKEAAFEKQNFTRHLRAVSAAVLQQVCDASCDQPEPFDLADCSSCQHLQARCRDPTVCAGSVVSRAVGLTLGVLALGAAVGRQARQAAGTETKEEPAAGRVEPPPELGDGVPTEQREAAPPKQRNEAPLEQGNEAPPEQGNVAQPKESEGARAGTQ